MSPQAATSLRQTRPLIPDYELLRPIGQGAYGEVWLARNVTGSFVALKIVRRAAFDHDRPFEREFEGIQRFEPISRSDPSQVAILHVGRGDGYFYYVMELADPVASGRSSVVSGPAEKPESNYGRSASLDTDALITDYCPRTLKHDLRTRGALPVAECVQVALSLTRALAHLHSHGLVHRDVKPSNVIFVHGVAKLADLGLVTSVDATRSFVGTEGYLPPEGAGTAQADLYSLGKVLYEMSTGCDRSQFPALPPDIVTRPDRDSIAELNAIVVRACQPDPRQRYTGVEAMRTDLELLQDGHSVKRRRTVERGFAAVRKAGLAIGFSTAIAVLSWFVSVNWQSRQTVANGRGASAPPAAEAKSIVALPFDNAGPDKADEFLGASITDEISSALAKVPEMTVLGRDSGIALKKSKDLRATAAPLKLQAVLSGSVRKSGNQVHITAQLIRPADGSLLWSEVYDRPWSEIFGIQTDIAENVARSVNVNLSETSRTRLAAKGTKNFEAYQLYLEGFGFLNASNESNAIASFERVIALDPQFAPGYAALAEALTEDTHEAYRPCVDIVPKAFDYATKAIQLDPRLPEGHVALARILCHFRYDWEGAEKEFQHAISLNPNSVRAHQRYSQLLGITGRFDEAIAHASLARKLDPLSAITTLGWNLFDAGRYDESLVEFKRVLELAENSAEAYEGMAWSYWEKGQTNEAIAAWGRSTRPEIYAELIHAYRDQGMEAYWRKHLEQAKKGIDPSNKSPYWIACDHAMLGEKDQAFEWLERAYEERAYYLPWMAVESRLINLHSDPRFIALLKKMRLKIPTGKK